MLTRVGLVLTILAAFAACGGDDGNNTGNTCGDGVKAGAEECDDGNTTSGDGCNSVCQLDTASVCGDGLTQVGNEECDDGNNVDGDGCSANCIDECGNGALDGIEMCDDGNKTNGDGCTSQCLVEPLYTCTGEPSICVTPSGACDDTLEVVLTDNAGTLRGTGSGTTAAGMNHVPAATCDELSGGDGNDQIWKLVLPETRDVTITIDPSTPFDAVLRLTTTPCDLSTEVPEYGGADGCSDGGAEADGEQLAYVALAAGTYYIVVDGYDDAAVGTYSFTVTAAPTVCGNGELDDGEECEDGNNLAGDRCSPNCTLEYDVLEVEPNDTPATAQVITPGSHLMIRGSLPGGDVDLYTFTLTAPSLVELETYDTLDGDPTNFEGVGIPEVDCLEADTILSVFDEDGDVTDELTAVYLDDEDGDLSCSYIGPNDSDGNTMEGVLPAGTYTIRVENFFSFFPAERYILDIKVTAGMTPPVNPNAPAPGDLVLNEVMANDGTADTNCDGVATTADTNDEYVELVNVSTRVLDLTGVTVSDVVGVRATLNASSTRGAGASLSLDPGKAVVVWAGGTPACAGVANWFLADTANGLGFNNGGDTVTVKNAAAQTLATYTYTATTAGKSFNLSPDITGTTYVLHDTLTGAAGAFSPGKKADGTAF
jgi:cysteine-rich repeat protein